MKTKSLILLVLQSLLVLLVNAQQQIGKRQHQSIEQQPDKMPFSQKYGNDLLKGNQNYWNSETDGSKGTENNGDVVVALTQGFESTWVPTGWALYSFGDPASWARTSSFSHSGMYSAYHNNTNVATLAKDWLVSPVINVINNHFELSFWQYEDRDYYYYNHKVVIMDGADPATAAFLDTLLTGPGTEDNWTYHEYSLAAYNGQSIYIGFYYEGDSDDRWYIDDVKVRYPENNDAAITAIVSPVDKFFPRPTEIIASLANVGLNTFTTCSLVCNVIDNTHGGTIIDDTIPWTGSLTYKDTININLGSFTPLHNTNYIISVSALLTGDEDNSNNTITANIYCDSIHNQYPYAQDFENGGNIPNFWQMGGFENWEFAYYMSAGANFDHTTGTGYFAGLDDSNSPDDEGQESYLLSPVFDFTTLNYPYLRFYYLNTDLQNPYSWISQLHIDITTDGENWTNDLVVITEQINQWTEYKVHLAAYANDTVQLRFRAVTSTSAFSDPSIDDVWIGEMPVNDLKTTLASPRGIRYHDDGGEKPRVIVFNEGSAVQANYKVVVTATDTASGNIVYLDSTTNQSNIASLSADTLTLPSTWNPAFGFYQIKAYVSMDNDENHSNDTIYETLYKSEWHHSDSTLPMSVYNGSSVAYSGTYGKYLFSIGGNTESGSGNEVFAYDVENNTWIEKTSLSIEMENGSAAVYGDKIFVQCGEDGPDKIDSCFSYDIATDSWTPIASLPIPTIYTSAATLNNSIYIAGGHDDYDNITDSVFRYDILTNTWHSASNLPVPVYGGSLINLENKLIYVWGEDGVTGITGKAIIGQVYPSNPDSITWYISSDSADLGAFQIQAAPLSNNALIVTSGLYEPTSTILSNTYVYYLSTDTWIKTASKPTPVYAYAAGSFLMNDSIRYIVAGGYGQENQNKATATGIDIVEYYNIKSHLPSPQTLVPAQNATNVATNTILSVTFDVDVDTMFTPAVTITDGVNFINVTAVVFNEASNTLEISHDVFNHSTTYTVNVQAGAFMSQELDGSLNEEISWSFTTLIPSVNVAPDTVLVNTNAGDTLIEVIANQHWTASQNQSWCNLILNDTTGNGTILAAFTANPNFNVRYTNIIIEGNIMGLDTLVLAQEGLIPTLSVSPSNINVSNNAGDTTFTITSNQGWTAVSNQSWCTVTANGTGNGTITATYSENTGFTSRTATITITGDVGGSQSVTIVQAGVVATLAVTPPTQNVNNAAGTTTFSVAANQGWAAVSNQTWCTVTSNGTGNGTITATYEANTGVQRTATITVTGAQSGTQAVTVVQAAAGVTTYTVTFGVQGTGGTIEARLGSQTGAVITSGAAIPAGDTIYFIATPDSNYEVADWVYNGSLTGLTTNIVAEMGLAGNITFYVIFEPTAIKEQNLADINIYPNPATERVNITSKAKMNHIQIMNLIGETVYAKDLNENKTEINVSHFTEGTYFVVITSENGQVVRKIQVIK